MFQMKVLEKTETHFMFNDFFFPPESRAVYEIMCKNTVAPDRSQAAIWRMSSVQTHTQNM